MKNQKKVTRVKQMNNHSQFVIYVLHFLVLVFLCNSIGCFHKPEETSSQSPNHPILKRIGLKKNKKTKNEENFGQTQTELVFNVNGHIEALSLSQNARHVLVEKYLDNNEKINKEKPEKFLSGNTLNRFGVELWNVEFYNARLENFSPQQIELLEPTINCVTFDEDGERLFWIGQELAPYGIVAEKEKQENQFPHEDLLGFHTQQESNSFITSNIQIEKNFTPNNKTLTGRPGNKSYRANVVLTRTLEKQVNHEETRTGKSTAIDIRHVKIASEIKNADHIWLSPNARWIVCCSTNWDKTEKKDISNSHIDKRWTLVLLRDRNRVVHFPATIKMTFNNSTSNESFDGKIIDILDISDQGDLVATLVEEQKPEVDNPPKQEITLCPPPKQNQDQAPKYKIVIWDLKVARTVEIEKAKHPLMALEVSQIAISAPVSRRFCKFSPNGDWIAARLEPQYITVWQSANGRLSLELGEHGDIVRDFTFAPRSPKMLVGLGGKKGQVVLWEIRKGVVLRTFEEQFGHIIEAVAFTHDENYAYFANEYGEIKRWNIRAK